MRTQPMQLPSYEELCDILAHEAELSIPQSNESLHFGDFSTITTLLSSYGIDHSFFDPGLTYEDLKDGQTFSRVLTMFDELVSKILENQDNQKHQELCNNLYDYLSEEDEVENVDLIFVFGSKSTIRTQKAIELYKAGRAPSILISGKGPFYEEVATPEAELLAQFAISQNVPADALILEKDSITVPDNVKRSLLLLGANHVPHESVILVNSPFAQRRGWAHFSKMSGPDTRIIRCSADVSEQFSRDGWYRNEAGAKVIVKEFFGLRVSELLNTS